MNLYEYNNGLNKYREHQNELMHYGTKGQKRGVRHWQDFDGKFNQAGYERYFGSRRKGENKNGTVFISGSSKTQFDDNEFYRPELPDEVKNEIQNYIKAGKTILVGDAPGIDRQVQDYLNEQGYNDVEIYSPGTKVRYSANPRWKTNLVDVPGVKEGSGEWLKGKDEAMTNRATEGLAITIEDGAAATRNNVERLKNQNKGVKVFELKKNGKDRWTENEEKLKE